MDSARLKELCGIALTEDTEKLVGKISKMNLQDAKATIWTVIKKNGDLTQDQKMEHADKLIKSETVEKALKVIANIQKGAYKSNVEAVRK